MSMQPTIGIDGFPSGVSPDAVAACRARIHSAYTQFVAETGQGNCILRIGHNLGAEANRSHQKPEMQPKVASDEPGVEKRALNYSAKDPLFQLSDLIVQECVLDELMNAISLLQLEERLFDDWGLRAIEPFPRSVVNLHGPPGTGKTLAAHAIAHKMGQQIFFVCYSEVESKFHGDVPKNIDAVFFAVERDEDLLFVDEADSLLSRRLTDVSQGSEQAINSMRSQLLICLERFSGMVVFATNLVENYDRAFETRVKHIHFPLPDTGCREKFWNRHFVPKLPIASDVDAGRLAAEFEDVCGRVIRNAVIAAATRAARDGRSSVSVDDFRTSLSTILQARIRPPEKSGELNTANLAAKVRKAFAAQQSQEARQDGVDESA